MEEFYLTELGNTLRIDETDDGWLSIEVLKDGEWKPAPRGMIGLRISSTTRRLTAAEIKALP